jgi:hypothetical protein
LKRIIELAKQGLPICLKQSPKQPGFTKTKGFGKMLEELKQLPNVSQDFAAVVDHKALIEGDSLPAYWAREQADGSLIIFLAQSRSKDLEYPVYSGQSIMKETEWKEVSFNYAGKSIQKRIAFKPYQSVALKLTRDGSLKFLDIEYIPEHPIVRPKEPQKSYF